MGGTPVLVFDQMSRWSAHNNSLPEMSDIPHFRGTDGRKLGAIGSGWGAAMEAWKKYWAFLSYSHQDTKLCEWLHRELETFPIPKRLVGRDSREGKIPPRLFPVFRDRDELPGSAELGKNLTEALLQSRYLIVICSPAAARSRWVNEEIRQFKMMGGEGRILALIVDGEPNAADKPNSGLLECFPEMLKYRVDASGNLTGQPVEPIAADIRRGRETKSIALLRLIAGLLGVPFDELRQRDQERARRSLLLRVIAGVTLVSLLAAGLVWRYRVDRMERLEAHGRDALMQSQPTHAAVFLAESYRMGNDSPDLRIMLDQAMRSVDMLTTVHSEFPEGIVNAAFSADSTRLIATSAKGEVSIWRADNGGKLVSLPAVPAKRLSHARFVSDGREVALLFEDGSITIVNARDGVLLREFAAPLGARPLPVSRQPASGDSTLFADVRGNLVVVDSARGNVVRALTTPCARVALSPRNVVCAAATSVATYDLSATSNPKPQPLSAEVIAISLHPSRREAALALTTGTWQLVDLARGQRVSGATHPGGIEAVQLSNKGDIVATGGTTGSVLLWSTKSGELLTQIQGHQGRVQTLHFLAADRRLASTGEDGSLRVWDTASGAMLSLNQLGQGAAGASAISADGTRLATWSASGRAQMGAALKLSLKVWDLAAAGPQASYIDAKTARERFLPGRQATREAAPTLRCGGALRRQTNSDNSISVIDVATGVVRATLQAGLDTAVADIDCDRAKQWYVTGGKSGAAVVWNAASGKPVARVVGHLRAIDEVAFMTVAETPPSDGEKPAMKDTSSGEFLTFSADGTAARWNFDEETRSRATILRRIACRVPLKLEGYVLLPTAEVECPAW